MKYKGVTRVITIYVSKVGQRYAIEVTPDLAEVVFRDKIVWNVQNAPRGVKHVWVGNIRRVDPAPDIQLRPDNKAPVVEARTINLTGKKGTKETKETKGLVYHTKKADIGYWKYDVFFDEYPVLDPEIEIKGTRGL